MMEPSRINLTFRNKKKIWSFYIIFLIFYFILNYTLKSNQKKFFYCQLFNFGASIVYYHQNFYFWSEDSIDKECDYLNKPFENLMETIPWRKDKIKVFGKLYQTEDQLDFTWDISWD